VIAVSALLVAGLQAPASAAVQTAVTAAKVTPVADRPDQVSAAMAARAQGSRVEVSGERTETTSTFVNPDGTVTLESHAQPIRALQADGSWAAVDTTLVKQPDGSYAPKSTPVSISVSGGGSASLVTVTDAGRSVASSWLAKLPAPTVSGSTATYANVLPNMDLVVTVGSQGFEDYLVLKAAPTTALGTLKLPLKGTGLTFTQDPAGNTVGKDAKGVVVASMPAPRMWGAAVDPASQEPVKTSAVPTKLVTNANGSQELDVTPDPAFLADPSVTYPITVDPGLGINRGNWTYVDHAFPTSNYLNSATVARAGTPDGGNQINRSFFDFALGSIAGKHVVSANFTANENWSYSCTAEQVDLWQTGEFGATTTWNSEPVFNQILQSATVAHGYSSSCPTATVPFDITTGGQYWASHNSASVTLALRSPNETSNLYWKKFDNNPVILVTYNSYPSQPVGRSVTPCTAVCGAPITTGSLTPTLTASSGDVDGGNLSFYYEVWAGSSASPTTLVASSPAVTVPQGTTSHWQVPASAGLVTGSTYEYRVRSFDGLDYSPWSSGYIVFTPDTTAPAAPSIAATHYANNAWYTAGGADTFTYTDAAGDIDHYLYGIDTGTPTQSTVAGATGSSVITPPDGWHSLTVEAVDKAGNVSAPTTWTFGGVPGFATPVSGQTTLKTLGMTSQASPTPGFTRVTYNWRRSSADAFAPMNAAFMSLHSDGSAVSNPYQYTNTDGSGKTSAPPRLDVDLTYLLSALDGPVQLQVCFDTGPSTTTYCSSTSAPLQVLLNQKGFGQAYATAPVGPGTVSLATGNVAVGSTDVSAPGAAGSDLSVARTFNSLDTKAAPADAIQLLNANEQDMETGITDFTVHNATQAQSTTRVFTGSKSLSIAPAATGSTDYTAVSVGGDTGAMRLGMLAGHTYTLTGKEYVPASTGLTTANTSGLNQQMVVYYRSGGTGTYSQAVTNVPAALDSWQPLSVTFTLPVGTTEALLRLWNGWATGAGNTGKVVYYDSLSLAQQGVFGPGWVSNLPVGSAGSDYTGLSDAGSTVSVTTSDASKVIFAQTAGGYVATGVDTGSGLTLAAVAGTNGATSFSITDLDGNVTQFKRSTATFAALPTVGVPHAYTVDTVSSPGVGATTYAYLTDGRVDLETAPAPTGATCSNWTTAPPTTAQWPVGCRGLKMGYNATSELTSVTLVTDLPATGITMIDMACYGYNANGQLTSTWDPRNATPGTGSHPVVCNPIAPVLATGYSYYPSTPSDATSGQIQTITPPGLAAWTLSYDSAGRFTSAARTHNATYGGGTLTSTVLYGVPLAADGANPANRPDMTSGTVATWAQSDVPTTATVVFGPGDSFTDATGDLRDGQITYIDADGRAVNTANYAGTGAAGWHIDTTEYDATGNTIRTLTAADREEALNPAGAPASLGLGADTASNANRLSTINVYATAADGVLDLTDTYGPYHQIWYTNSGGAVAAAHAHTHIDYDPANPGSPAVGNGWHPSGASLHLPVTQTTGATLTADVPPAPGTLDGDARTTTSVYALASGDATGWTFHKPMQTVVDPAGLAITSTTRYDAFGNVIESRQPAHSGGGDAGTTKTIYYTADATSGDTACNTKPTWAGLECKTLPAAQPGVSGLPTLVTTTTTSYDYLQRPLTVVETANDGSGTSSTRTASSYFDFGMWAARPTYTTVVMTGGLAGNAAVPTVTTGYDTTTGLPLTSTAAATTGTGAQSASTATTWYDDFGQVVKYRDGSAAGYNETSTSYDTAGRVATVADNHQSITYGYNAAGEHRGLTTSQAVTVTGTTTYTGTFSGSYDADGALATQTFPDGLTQTTTRDESGKVVQLLDRTSGGVTWLYDSGYATVDGQFANRASTSSSFDYKYDKAGRLITAAQTTPTGCITRTYGFDADSNRSSSNAYPDLGAGCQSASGGVPAAHTYDVADRLQPAGTDSGLTYDTLGRTTTLPAADTNNPGSGNNLTVAYYTNDLVQTQTLATRTLTWTLDASGRLATRADSSDATATQTNHYDDASSDSPDWIGENTSGTNWTVNTTGLDGNLAVTINQAGTPTYQLTNLHGDINATYNVGDPAPTYRETDEYGNPVTGTTTRYGWVGGKQRAGDDLAGLILMGVRLYNPTLGLFLSVDPVPGGNRTAYGYPVDPVDVFDLTGRWGWGWVSHAARWVGAHGSELAGGFALGACIVASAGVCAAAAGFAFAASFATRTVRAARTGNWGSGYWRGVAFDAATSFLPGARAIDRGFGVLSRFGRYGSSFTNIGRRTWGLGASFLNPRLRGGSLRRAGTLLGSYYASRRWF
jgi:RHS repeat-associated protein